MVALWGGRRNGRSERLCPLPKRISGDRRARPAGPETPWPPAKPPAPKPRSPRQRPDHSPESGLKKKACASSPARPDSGGGWSQIQTHLKGHVAIRRTRMTADDETPERPAGSAPLSGPLPPRKPSRQGNGSAAEDWFYRDMGSCFTRVRPRPVRGKGLRPGPLSGERADCRTIGKDRASKGSCPHTKTEGCRSARIAGREGASAARPERIQPPKAPTARGN